ncbi:kinB-signaling pathway activation protein [Paenibacillus montaniterrae]|uniref:KinB-signaling pathway activation protein n=1 Tax=Paenibacillus montaniterrae TaxID=429341 RepID=A0A919YUW6_9BACL|nr:KinB-signaling pathway activation protein [Paenibacillus montaniterrae]GIP19572.1 kinB-signaling pathway activation protein [Paenibacillus montaniterrae]
MTLRKWFFLFWSTMAVGAVVCMVGGLIMLLTDQEFGFLGFKATGFNLLMMFLAGITIGAFSQMGFFAYLTLNYIALSVFRKKYLWNALQGYTTLFAVILMGYLLYEGRTNNWFFWLLPLCLLILSVAAAWIKVKQTNRSAFIPTMFLMFVVTAIEGYPALQGDNNVATIIFMLLPLFACNFYQNYQMAKLTAADTADSANVSAKTAV